MMIENYLLRSRFGNILTDLWSDLDMSRRFPNSLQIMEYSHLLDMADQCEDPAMKLAYACKPYCPLLRLFYFGLRSSYSASYVFLLGIPLDR